MRIIDFAFLEMHPYLVLQSSVLHHSITSIIYIVAVSLGSMNEFTEFIFEIARWVIKRQSMLSLFDTKPIEETLRLDIGNKKEKQT